MGAIWATEDEIQGQAENCVCRNERISKWERIDEEEEKKKKEKKKKEADRHMNNNTLELNTRTTHSGCKNKREDIQTLLGEQT